MWSSAIASVFVVLAIPLGGGDDDSLPVRQNNELQIWSVADLVAPSIQASMPDFGRALGGFSDESKGGWMSTGLSSARVFQAMRQPVRADLLPEVLRLPDETQWEREGAMMDVSGSRLVVANERPVLDRVKATLRRLRATVVPRVELEFVAFKAARPSTFRHLDAAEAAAMARKFAAGGGGRVLASGVATGRAGDRLRLGSSRHLSYVADLNVEIAEKSAIADPSERELDLSESLTLRTVVAPDGHTLGVFGFFSLQTLAGALRTQGLPGAAMSQLELADVDQAQLMFSFAVDGEGGVVVAAGGRSQPDLQLFVRARRIDAAPQPAEDFLLIPTGLLDAQFFRAAWIEPPSKSGPGRGIQVTSLLPLDPTIEMLQSGLTDRDNVPILDLGATLAVRAKSADIASIRKARDFVLHDAVRSFVLEIQELGRPVGDTSAWRPLASVVIPCLANRVGCALVGRETSYVGGYSVEVATESKIADPETRSVFDGTRVYVAVEPEGKDVRVQLILGNSVLSSLRQVVAATRETGPTQCPDLHTTSMRRAITMQIDGTQELGAGPHRQVDGRTHETKFVLSVREL